MPRYSSIFVPAYAKINLTLSVLGRRDDGYHALASVMQTISLHDTLRITPNASGACVCETDVPALQSPDNLALRAAWLLAATAADGTPGVAIELRKEIPAQGGLGGGSGDAATVLVALNALWRTHHPQAELERLGATLGSDVPFFVRGGTCLIEGRGERVTPLPDVESLWLVLAKPPISIPTAAVFRALAPSECTSGQATADVAQMIRQGEPLPFERLTNSLEPGVLRTYPEVAATRAALLEAGAPLVRLSGSGPTLYAPFRQLAEAAAVHTRARHAGIRVWLCRTVPRAEVAHSRPT